ncbi:MAG: hypothetical protein H0V53_09640 [Rubrobacter sp.]|nr:hypothetical protein [Rubrobacter sp.]
MASTSERALREIARIEQEAVELREYLLEVELHYGMLRGRSRFLGGFRAFLIRAQVDRRLSYLSLRHRMAHNCYEQLRRGLEPASSGGRCSRARPGGSP